MKRRNRVLVLIVSSAFCCEISSARPAVSDPPVAAAEAPAGITANEAVDIVWQLPEAKAWSKFIRDQTNGEAHAALIVEPEQPESRRGKSYWSVNFYENGTSRYHRWQTFLIRTDGKEILADVKTSGEYRGLEEWRRIEKPMDRVREADRP
jgi:hypothetical protein